jgi:hypothetical protein
MHASIWRFSGDPDELLRRFRDADVAHEPFVLELRERLATLLDLLVRPRPAVGPFRLAALREHQAVLRRGVDPVDA